MFVIAENDAIPPVGHGRSGLDPLQDDPRFRRQIGRCNRQRFLRPGDAHEERQHENEDALPPIYVGASVERGVSTDAGKNVDSSRLVVVGNPTLLDQTTMLAVNRDFVAASLNWIINRENQIGITSKPRKSYRIQLTPRQSEIIFWLTSVSMPALVLLIGLMVWAGRRAA